MSSIAHTGTRLKGYVTLRAQRGGVDLADKNSVLNLNDLVIVGSANGFKIKQTRTTNGLRREFGPPFTGEPAETYPGLPEFALELRRVDLYSENMLESMGFSGTNIVVQKRPIVLVCAQAVPEDENGNPLKAADGTEFKRRSYIIPGCWFGSMDIEFDAEDADQKFALNVEMIARTVRTSDDNQILI